METIESLRQENELLKAQIEQLRKQAFTDSLTDLDNYFAFDTKLKSFWDLAERKADLIAVILLDLDHLKLINDNQGHAAGNEAIKSIAAILKKRCRRSDVPSRWGGDEFAVIMPQSDAAAATVLANDLLALIKEAGLSASIGISSCVAGLSSLDELLKKADDALYIAKRQRNCVIAL